MNWRPIGLFWSVFAIACHLPAAADVQATTPHKYGCYRVVGADAVNIRARPFSSSDVVGVAERGEILVKWRRWCTLRGFWCPVQRGDLKGHSDKRYLEPIACPPSLAGT